VRRRLIFDEDRGATTSRLPRRRKRLGTRAVARRTIDTATVVTTVAATVAANVVAVDLRLR